MLKVVICDDNESHISIVSRLLNEYQNDRDGIELEVVTFKSANLLLREINKDNIFNLFLLDILMPDLDGIELAKKIRSLDAEVPIVFLTSSANHMLDAFDVYAVQYLLKPIKRERLFEVIDKIVAYHKNNLEKYFLFAMPRRTIKISHSSIVCIELYNRVLRLYKADGSIMHSKSVRTKFTDSIEPLLEDERFLSSHKSFLVNMEFVEELREHAFVLKNGVHAPIPRHRYTEVRAKYFEWLKKGGRSILGIK